MTTTDLWFVAGNAVMVTASFWIGWCARSTLDRQARRPVLPPDHVEPVMHVECAWCRKYLGTKDCAPEYAGKVSHGACPECAAKALAEAKEGANGWNAVQTAAGGETLNVAIAAPDMLSALRLCVTNVGVPVREGMANAMERRLMQINEIAQAAIAKAEGRSE